jgi:shikimate dehydrogenase
MPDKVLGIIGHPIAHSLSPLMHNFAAKALGLNYVYVAFDVPPDSLRAAVAAIRALGIAGVNVTVPHKEKVIQALDGLEEDAAVIGAVNTITLADGRLVGANTDGIGFIRALKAAGVQPAGKKAVVIGAGGSSRAIGVSLWRAGVEGITVVNRSEPGGKRLARQLSSFGRTAFRLSSSAEARDAVAAADIVVQTTPVGMKKADPLPMADPPFRKGQLVYDIIYAPVETQFLKAAKKAGAYTMNGLSMLVYQGSESFKRWTGHRFPEEKVLRHLKKRLGGGR